MSMPSLSAAPPPTAPASEATDFSLAGWIRPYFSMIAIVGLCVCGQMLFTAGMPVGMSYLLDEALPTKDLGKMYVIFGIFALGVSIYITAGLVQDFWMSRIASGLICDLRSRMFRQLQRLSAKYYDGSSEADILSRFSGDLANVEGVIGSLNNWVAIPTLQVLVNLVLLFTLDWRLALLAALVFPVGLAAPKMFAAKSVTANDAKKLQESILADQVQENVAAQSLVRIFSLNSMFGDRFSRDNGVMLTRTNSTRRAGFMVERSTGIGIALLQVLVIAIGAMLVYRDVLSAGKLVAFQSLFFLMCDNLFFLMQNVPQLLQALSGLRRVRELLETEPAVEDLPGAKTLAPLQEAITFRHVTFSYDGQRPAVENVDLEIPRGKTVAIIGPSGCGKSTVLSLLLRMYDPQQGEIRFDGRDLRSATQDSLRHQIAPVLQESILFNTTVRENLRMICPEATEEQVAAAAAVSELDDAVRPLPQGIDTAAGLRGSRLSGGVRQRIALARAVLRNPPILVLDEATSALDATSEIAVNRHLADVWKGKTVVAATLRLSNIANFDRIYVLKNGQVVEQGTHQELLARRGLYAQMWQKQSGFVMEEAGVTVTPDRLRDIPLLSRLADDMLTRISTLFETEKFEADRIVVQEGDPGDKFYIIVRGKAEAYKDLPDGTRKRFTIMGDGDVFGEMALLKNMPRTATVRTLSPTVVITLSRKHFLEILEEAPGVREELETLLATRK